MYTGSDGCKLWKVAYIVADVMNKRCILVRLGLACKRSLQVVEGYIHRRRALWEGGALPVCLGLNSKRRLQFVEGFIRLGSAVGCVRYFTVFCVFALYLRVYRSMCDVLLIVQGDTPV